MLTGTGSAGAYHAGVLRALREAGVRIDLVAGRGMGAVSALFAAVDADARLWDKSGIWLRPGAAAGLYRWSATWRTAGLCVAVAGLAMILPLLALALAALAYPAVFLVQLLAPVAGASVVARYSDWLAFLLSADVLASIVPRAATVGLMLAVLVLVARLVSIRVRRRPRQRARGAEWWRALGLPFDASHAAEWAADGFWAAIRGAAPLARPAWTDLARRYSELLGDSLGQPGYRELVITTHDIDARRDLVFAMVAKDRRASHLSAPGDPQRRGEIVDLAGAGRDHVFDAIAGALSLPILCEPRTITFATDGYWRGETHRLCDRPSAVGRLLTEVSLAGATQVIVVSAVSELPGPHGLSAPRLEPRARLGEALQAVEAASLHDALGAAGFSFNGVFEIRPSHNPVGPFDLAGGYDDRSDRAHSLRELVARGYEDAYRQFLEPVVGASGEALPQAFADEGDGGEAPGKVQLD